MRTEFTKGEWTHRQNEIGGLMQSHFLIEGEERALPIAKVYSDTMNLEKALANAKLIAAAPDMFKVCRLLEYVKSESDLQSIKNIAKEAIKKATE